MVFAVPTTTSPISLSQSENTLLTQADDVGFAARAPPLAVTNVAITGGVTSMQGSAFAMHGQETVAALFGFDDDTLSVSLNRHLQDNFASGTVGPSTHASNVGTITVKGPIIGPNGTTEIVTSGWSIRADGSVTLNTAW
jgi:hypothetical protein